MQRLAIGDTPTNLSSHIHLILEKLMGCLTRCIPFMNKNETIALVVYTIQLLLVFFMMRSIHVSIDPLKFLGLYIDCQRIEVRS